MLKLDIMSHDFSATLVRLYVHSLLHLTTPLDLITQTACCPLRASIRVEEISIRDLYSTLDLRTPQRPTMNSSRCLAMTIGR